MDILQPFNGGTRPSTWPQNEDAIATLSSISYSISRCERFSWGQFERGPIFVLREYHTNFEAPQECKEGDHSTRAVLESIWFSDPDIANYAQEEFGMPARVAQFDYNVSTVDDTQVFRWSMLPEDGVRSEMVTFDSEATLKNSATFTERYYWSTGSGVSYIDITDRYTTPEPQPSSAYGTMPPPMLWGRSMPTSEFLTLDRAGRLATLESSARISQFSDTQCKQPM